MAVPNTLKRPFIAYNHHQNHLYPQVPEENFHKPGNVERFDHVAANGRTASYEVGPRDFISMTFPWQSDAKKLEWDAWWEDVRGGQKFYLGMIDTSPICGDGTVCGDGSIVGVGDTGETGDVFYVQVDMVDFDPEPGDVDGYWTVDVRFRRVV